MGRFIERLYSKKTLHNSSKREFSTNGKERRWWSHRVGGGCIASNGFGKLEYIESTAHGPAVLLSDRTPIRFAGNKIRQHKVSSKNMLKSVLKDQWEKISAEETPRFVSSMLKRLQQVLT
ncbi:hypothetical protein TNCV_3405091 [Trichonephila clavipes]|nr:hypothetical protein TNCV_3405091 [Trichonephila clavipes]